MVRARNIFNRLKFYQKLSAVVVALVLPIVMVLYLLVAEKNISIDFAAKEIAAASREQSTGITQVNDAITHMDEAVQQNAALVEEVSAASESMDKQAQALTQMMVFFRTGDDPRKVAVDESEADLSPAR